jgi:hypothetical protein
MNREDVIRMAREAGLTGLMEGGLIDYFERFAKLVAAAEREACAEICAQFWDAHLSGAEWCMHAIRARGHDE